jgi:putative Ca2+/H+ antiporter (TMEM165/GDT1 family)
MEASGIQLQIIYITFAKNIFMQTVLILHNILRWGVLIFGLWALIGAISGVASKRSYSASDNRSSLLFMIFCDIQLLFGLLLFFLNSWLDKIKTNGMGATMKNAYDRFFTVEHAGMMLLALIFVHIGRASVKRAQPPAVKHKKTLIFFGIALLIIFISIPWPFRNEIARPLFRWFN